MNTERGTYWDFYFNYDMEQLALFIDLPAIKKLEWLEEYIDFLEEAMPPETKEIFLKFRRGEVVKTD